MTNFRSLADFASAVMGLTTLCVIAYALISAVINRNGGGK